jgi:hypothetical protein
MIRKNIAYALSWIIFIAVNIKLFYIKLETGLFAVSLQALVYLYYFGAILVIKADSPLYSSQEKCKHLSRFVGVPHLIIWTIVDYLEQSISKILSTKIKKVFSNRRLY